MKIQIISANETNNIEEDDIVTRSNFSTPRSIDEYDYNFIDLSSPKLWISNDRIHNSIYSNDFNSIMNMILNSKRTQIIIILPLNIEFQDNYLGTEILLKDEIYDVLNHNIKKLIPESYSFPLISFEITDTVIGDSTVITSHFTFEGEEYYDIMGNQIFINDNLTISKISNKCTTILIKKLDSGIIKEKVHSDIIMTSLQLETNNKIFDFLETAGLINNNKTEIPEWMEQIEFYNDKQLKEEIENEENNIQDAKKVIELNREKLKNNNKYKSILYENGTPLEDVVKEMLEKIFDIDLSKFKDIKKEDFLFKIDDRIIIGEIKGKNQAMKNLLLSQLDMHHSDYLDKHPEANDDNIRSVFITNHQIHKPLNERADIDKNIITRAENKFGILIIETNTLLRLYEKRIKGEITVEKCRELLNTVGLLEEKDF